MGDRPRRSLQHRRIVALGMVWRAPSTERHVSAALCVACPGVRAVSCSAAVLDIRAALCRVARVSLARNRSADQGNYDLIWWISVGLGVFAALIHWFIRE